MLIKSAVISCSAILAFAVAAILPAYLLLAGIELAVNFMKFERNKLEQAGFIIVGLVVVPLVMVLTCAAICMITTLTMSLVNTLHIKQVYRRLDEGQPELATPLLAVPERVETQRRVSV